MSEGLTHWLRGLSLPARVAIYTALAISAFLLAVVVGGFAAVAMGGDLSLPGRNAPEPSGGSAEDTMLQGTTLQGTSSQDKSVTDSQYAAPEGEVGRVQGVRRPECPCGKRSRDASNPRKSARATSWPG